MNLPIYLYGHPVLRKESAEVSPEYKDLKKLIADTKINCDIISVSKKDDGVRIVVEITYTDNDMLYRFIKNALSVDEILEVYSD